MYAKKANKIISQANKEYSAILFNVFAAKKSLFKGINFNAEFNIKDEYLKESILFETGSADHTLLQITKRPNCQELIISLMLDQSEIEDIPTEHMIRTIINNIIKDLLFKKYIPRVFIASAERTGTAIFQKEIDFTRNRCNTKKLHSNNAFLSVHILCIMFYFYTIYRCAHSEKRGFRVVLTVCNFFVLHPPGTV